MRRVRNARQPHNQAVQGPQHLDPKNTWERLVHCTAEAASSLELGPDLGSRRAVATMAERAEQHS